jgi:protein-S-isoprenylcysteine O-methyltransferase Ste14
MFKHQRSKGVNMSLTILNKINSLFNNKALRAFLLKFRIPICLVFIALALPRLDSSLLLPAFLVSLFGELIQLWSFASLDKNANIAARGPYSLSRNPMYLGRFFLILGAIILLHSIIIAVIYTVLYYFYMVNRVKREEIKLQEIFGEDYKLYCSQVNRFLPAISKADWKSVPFFRWKLFFQNHAHWNFLSMLLLYLLFYLFTIFKADIKW